MLFSSPPGYTTPSANRQSVAGRGAPGTQSVLAQPPPSFPGSSSATGGLSGGGSGALPPFLQNYGTSGYHVPSSYIPSSSSPGQQPAPMMGGKQNVMMLLKALMGGHH